MIMELFFYTIYYFLYKIFLKNKYSAYMIITYMFSFYHNMIFDFYTLILIVFYYKKKENI